jgi:hypothetical protein
LDQTGAVRHRTKGNTNQRRNDASDCNPIGKFSLRSPKLLNSDRRTN